jgi:hypothetical protein
LKRKASWHLLNAPEYLFYLVYDFPTYNKKARLWSRASALLLLMSAFSDSVDSHHSARSGHKVQL